MVYPLTVSDSIPPDLEQTLFEGLNKNAKEQKGMDPVLSFSVSIKDEKGKILGGACGVTMFGSIYTDMLWLDPTLRKQGYGKKLMLEAEKIALARGCTFAIVHTMDWEALGFYQNLGYQVEHIREGYAKNSKQYLLRKDLTT
ncbi:MAG: GNAT family N-acetyltransferase [Chlamydiae bacterium]|nr:GNAT family N-acetyltransferase [Chlamydiota bacterium]